MLKTQTNKHLWICFDQFTLIYALSFHVRERQQNKSLGCGSDFCLKNGKWFQFRSLYFLFYYFIICHTVNHKNRIIFLLLKNHFGDQHKLFFFNCKTGISFKYMSHGLHITRDNTQPGFFKKYNIMIYNLLRTYRVPQEAEQYC